MSMSVDFKYQNLTNRSDLVFNHTDLYLRANLTPFVHNHTPNNKTYKSDKDILFQIVGIRDIKKSTISYIESLIEMIDINDGFRYRQQKNSTVNTRQRVINSVNVEEEENQNSDPVFIDSSNKLFKLTLQDSFGNLSYAIEITPIPFLRQNVTGNSLYPIKLGSKLLIKKNTNIIFNCFQLKKDDCVFLGGELDKLNYNLYSRELDKYKTLIGYQN